MLRKSDGISIACGLHELHVSGRQCMHWVRWQSRFGALILLMALSELLQPSSAVSNLLFLEHFCGREAEAAAAAAEAERQRAAEEERRRQEEERAAREAEKRALRRLEKTYAVRLLGSLQVARPAKARPFLSLVSASGLQNVGAPFASILGRLAECSCTERFFVVQESLLHGDVLCHAPSKASRAAWFLVCSTQSEF